MTDPRLTRVDEAARHAANALVPTRARLKGEPPGEGVVLSATRKAHAFLHGGILVVQGKPRPGPVTVTPPDGVTLPTHVLRRHPRDGWQPAKDATRDEQGRVTFYLPALTVAALTPEPLGDLLLPRRHVRRPWRRKGDT